MTQSGHSPLAPRNIFANDCLERLSGTCWNSYNLQAASQLRQISTLTAGKHTHQGGSRGNMARNLRHLAVHLALAAMVLRALLPAGWMPNVGGQPGSALIICSMDGGADMSAGHASLPSKHQPDGRGEHDGCPFAAAPHLATAAMLPAVLRPQLAQYLVPGNGQSHAAPALPGYAPNNPRAPPSLI